VGAAVGVTVGAAVVAAALGVGLGASVVGAAVRIWTVGLADAVADALALADGDGDADAPAKRDSPPPRITPISRSVSRPPASAARMRSIQRGPRRGGGMIFVVSDMSALFRTRHAGRLPGGRSIARLFAPCGARRP
jgi:hypothetical protein